MSLRRRLMLTLLAVVMPVVVLLSGALFWAVSAATWAAFDRDLAARAGTLAAIVEYDDDGYEFDMGHAPAPTDEGAGATDVDGPWTWARISLADGRVLSESRLEAGENASVPTPQWTATRGSESRYWVADDLGDARGFRAYRLEFVPEVEPDAARALRAGEIEPAQTVTVVVVRSTANQQRMLWQIGGWFIALGLVTLGTAVFAAWWAVQKGLAPVGQLVKDLQGMDADHLGARLGVDGLPRELRPVAQRTNELLERLARSFEQERRFTADVAHELRTPLAVLQTELELSLRRERSGPEYRESLDHSLGEVRQLSRLVEDLLTLARADARRVEVHTASISLPTFVHKCWAPYAEKAAARGLTFELDLDGIPEMPSDPDLLRIVVSNLLSNAVEYTEPGGWIRVHAPADAVLAVTDSGPPIPEAQRAKLFDRFWRADDARSDAGVHCGVGLALVRSVANVLGLRASVSVADTGEVTFSLHRV